MKIEIVGNRRPWLDGKPRDAGWIGEVDNETGQAVIDNGMAKLVDETPKITKRAVKK